MSKILTLPAIFIAASMLSACARGPQTVPAGPAPDGGVLLREAGQPMEEAPPIRKGVTISYQDSWTGTDLTWRKPHTKPVVSPYSGTGSTTNSYGVDRKTHIYYDQHVSVRPDATTTENQYYGYVALGGGKLGQLYYFDNYTNTRGQSGTDAYPQAQLVNVFPLTNGTRWTSNAEDIWTFQNGPAASETSDYKADGSYVLHFSNGGGASVESASSDGTGKLVLTWAGKNALVYDFGLPVSSGGAYKIPVYLTGGNKLPAPPAKRHLVAQHGDWYPDPKSPLPMYTDVSVVGAAPAMPASCGTLPGRSAGNYRETFHSVDPAYGEIFDETFDVYFIATRGMTVEGCEVLNYTRTDYDQRRTGTPTFQEKESYLAVVSSIRGSAPGGRLGALTYLPDLRRPTPIRAR